MKIFQVYPNDSLARESVTTVLNSYHDKRIRQKTLDFYRNGCVSLLSKNGSVVWLVSIDEDSGLRTGISLCAFGAKTKKVMHSITVVHAEFRRVGLGKLLLSSKMKILRKRHPNISYKSFVNINNEPSVKMCVSAGLIITDKGSRERTNSEPTEFFIFEDI